MNRTTAVQVFSFLAMIIGLVVSYYPPTTNGAAIWATVGGFLGYAIRDLFGVDAVQGTTTDKPAPTPAASSDQAGRANISALVFTCVLAAASLAGCGTMNSTIAGLEQKTVADVRGANDNMVHGLEAAICGVPIGAIIRNTEFVPVARAACLPSGGESNPATLFDQIPKAKPAGQ